MKKRLKQSIAMSFASIFILSVAGPTSSQSVLAEEGYIDFESQVTNEGEAIEGGTLKYALVGDPFEGILNSVLYTNQSDSTIISFFNEGIMGYDSSFYMDDSGFADFELNKDEKSVTITIPKDAKWSDGQAITIDDVILPYYIIGSPDYIGLRYGKRFENVVGMKDYHEGKTEEISGLERVDDHTLKVHYETFNNSMKIAGGSIASYIEPSHILKDIPVSELEDSEYVRSKPVGFGPFKVENIVPGESVTMVANEHYYKGKPKIERIQIDVVNPSSAVAEMMAGNYDMAQLPSDQYATFKDAKNFKTIGVLENSYNYIGFKTGTMDPEEGEVKMDESKPVSNKALRRAMGYAIDSGAIAKEFYDGIRKPANSPIPPIFDVYNKDQEGFTYDPEKAKKLLDEAGFKDTNGDGFVEDPNGEEFQLGLASMSGGETAEPIAQYYLQSWKEIGINIELVDGRLMEFNTFYDRLDKDDPAIDVFAAAQGVGGDPNPTDQFGRTGGFNDTRWTNEENDKLLEDIASDKSFDEEFRKETFKKWQALIFEEAPVIPTIYRYGLISVNNRVSHYDFEIGTDLNWSEIYLTADKPIK